MTTIYWTVFQKGIVIPPKFGEHSVIHGRLARIVNDGAVYRGVLGQVDPGIECRLNLN